MNTEDIIRKYINEKPEPLSKEQIKELGDQLSKILNLPLVHEETYTKDTHWFCFGHPTTKKKFVDVMLKYFMGKYDAKIEFYRPQDMEREITKVLHSMKI